MKRPGQLRRRKGPSASWRRSRRWCEDRTGGRCEARTPSCVGRGAQAHHILMRSQGGGDGLDNLLWVCGPCHDWIHAHPAVSYESGWLVRGVLVR